MPFSLCIPPAPFCILDHVSLHQRLHNDCINIASWFSASARRRRASQCSTKFSDGCGPGGIMHMLPRHATETLRSRSCYILPFRVHHRLPLSPLYHSSWAFDGRHPDAVVVEDKTPLRQGRLASSFPSSFSRWTSVEISNHVGIPMTSQSDGVNL